MVVPARARQMQGAAGGPREGLEGVLDELQRERADALAAERQVDDGVRPGTTSEENAKIRRLEQEVRELRRANEILRSASAFFAAELDRPHR